MNQMGSIIPYAEPSWYQGLPSPFYTPKHREFRDKVRSFMEEHVIPHVDTWIASPQGYPYHLHAQLYQSGISGICYPKEYGGTPPKDFDYLYEVILWDELARSGGGSVLTQLSVNSMALPPIIEYGSEELKQRVLPDVISGGKSISLAISEPSAGSDVSALKTTAVKMDTHYLVNGSKKWITGGCKADYYLLQRSAKK